MARRTMGSRFGPTKIPIDRRPCNTDVGCMIHRMIIMSQRNNSKNNSSATTKSKNGNSKAKQRVTFASSNNNNNSDDVDIDDGSDADDDEEEVLEISGSKPKGSSISTQHNTDLELCDVPSFQLPVSMLEMIRPDAPQRYELWTVRIPSSVQLQDLEDCTIPIHPNNHYNGDRFEASTNTTTNGTTDTSKYQFLEGHTVENESFRLLTTDPNDDNDNNNSNTSSTSNNRTSNILRPSSVMFQKHYNVIRTPSSSTATTTNSTTFLPPPPQQRHAYAPVPQKTGLKRRWVPFGTTVSTTKEIRSKSSINNHTTTTTMERNTNYTHNMTPVIKQEQGTTEPQLISRAPLPIKEEDHTLEHTVSNHKRQRNDVDDVRDSVNQKKKKKDRSSEDKKAKKKEQNQKKKQKTER
jgi:DNA-directed RNA polymerase I subunit RPA34.5